MDSWEPRKHILGESQDRPLEKKRFSWYNIEVTTLWRYTNLFIIIIIVIIILRHARGRYFQPYSLGGCSDADSGHQSAAATCFWIINEFSRIHKHRADRRIDCTSERPITGRHVYPVARSRPEVNVTWDWWPETPQAISRPSSTLCRNTRAFLHICRVCVCVCVFSAKL